MSGWQYDELFGMGMAPAAPTAATVMIKFTATTPDNRKLLGLGLSHVNLDRLRDNQPIRFKGEAVGLDGVDVLIFAGKTEESMAKELDPAITAQAQARHGTIIKDTS